MTLTRQIGTLRYVRFSVELVIYTILCTIIVYYATAKLLNRPSLLNQMGAGYSG
jgi:hypothetical protein